MKSHTEEIASKMFFDRIMEYCSINDPNTEKSKIIDMGLEVLESIP